MQSDPYLVFYLHERVKIIDRLRNKGDLCSAQGTYVFFVKHLFLVGDFPLYHCIRGKYIHNGVRQQTFP